MKKRKNKQIKADLLEHNIALLEQMEEWRKRCLEQEKEKVVLLETIAQWKDCCEVHRKTIARCGEKIEKERLEKEAIMARLEGVKKERDRQEAVLRELVKIPKRTVYVKGPL